MCYLHCWLPLQVMSHLNLSMDELPQLVIPDDAVPASYHRKGHNLEQVWAIHVVKCIVYLLDIVVLD